MGRAARVGSALRAHDGRSEGRRGLPADATAGAPWCRVGGGQQGAAVRGHAHNRGVAWKSRARVRQARVAVACPQSGGMGACGRDSGGGAAVTAAGDSRQPHVSEADTRAQHAAAGEGATAQGDKRIARRPATDAAA